MAQSEVEDTCTAEICRMQMGLNQFSSLVEWNLSIWIPITEHTLRFAFRIQSAGQGASAEKEGDINKMFEGCPFPFKASWMGTCSICQWSACRVQAISNRTCWNFNLLGLFKRCNGINMAACFCRAAFRSVKPGQGNEGSCRWSWLSDHREEGDVNWGWFTVRVSTWSHHIESLIFNNVTWQPHAFVSQKILHSYSDLEEIWKRKGPSGKLFCAISQLLSQTFQYSRWEISAVNTFYLVFYNVLNLNMYYNIFNPVNIIVSIQFIIIDHIIAYFR